MAALVTCKFEDDLIKSEGAILRKALSSGQHFLHYKSMGNFLLLKGELFQTKYNDLAQIQTSPRFYACPDHLQV